MRILRTTALPIALACLTATPAFADVTAFIGATMTPSSRVVKGVAAGVGLAIIGFEFEYASTSEDKTAVAPSLKTGMANALLQSPFPIFRFQPYVTAGAGFYRESLSTTGRQQTNFGINTGAGVKISLVGPVRLRVDYRVFKLGSGALNSPAHRVYVGINLKL